MHVDTVHFQTRWHHSVLEKFFTETAGRNINMATSSLPPEWSAKSAKSYHTNSRVSLGQVVVNLRIGFVPFQVLPINQALNSLLQIRWFDWKLKLQYATEESEIFRKSPKWQQPRFAWSFTRTIWKWVPAKENIPVETVQLLTVCGSTPCVFSWSGQWQHQSVPFLNIAKGSTTNLTGCSEPVNSKSDYQETCM